MAHQRLGHFTARGVGASRVIKSRDQQHEAIAGRLAAALPEYRDHEIDWRRAVGSDTPFGEPPFEPGLPPRRKVRAHKRSVMRQPNGRAVLADLLDFRLP
jgi:hypothetical protein